MGDIFSPKEMKQPQNKANDVFSGVLGKYLQGMQPNWNPQSAYPGGAGAPQDLGSYISTMFSMPQYGGQLTADPSDAITSALTEIMSGGGGSGGPPMDLASIYNTLDTQRRQGLTRDLGQLEEEFGVAGLGDSTSLYESAARRQTESEGNLMAEVSRMAPDLINAFSNQSTNRLNAAHMLYGFDQQGLDRMYNEFLRTQQLFPQILSFLAGAPPVQYGASPFQNLTNAGLTTAALGQAFG